MADRYEIAKTGPRRSTCAGFATVQRQPGTPAVSLSDMRMREVMIQSLDQQVIRANLNETVLTPEQQADLIARADRQRTLDVRRACPS